MSVEEKKLWACNNCGVTFISTRGEGAGVNVTWEKYGGGLRKKVIQISTSGECPGCGEEEPEVTAIKPQR